MKYLKLTLATLVMLTLTSCATLINGSKQKVSFVSEPSGAEVTLVRKGKETNIGQTPLEYNVPRKTKKVIFSKEGYYSETYDARAEAEIHWLYWVDLFGTFFTLVPAPIDIISGGYIELEPKVKVEMKKK